MTYSHDGYSEEALDAAMAETGGGGKYLGMKSGEPAVMITVFGKPFIEDVVWNGSTNIPFDPTQHEKASKQISLNVWNHDEGKVQILQGGKALLIEYMNKCKTYGNATGEVTKSGREVKTIHHVVFKAYKTGKDNQTRFNFDFWPNTDAPSPDKLVPFELHKHGALAKSQRNGGGAPEHAPLPTQQNMPQEHPGYAPDGSELPF